MTKINDLIQSRQLDSIENQNNKVSSDEEKKDINFSDTIKDFLNAVNEDKKDASKAVQDVITHKSDNIAEAMSKLEEANLSFNLMLKIRNKVLDAYNEIKNMPV
jgi:flagellar hook-basal body complex protein FliE